MSQVWVTALGLVLVLEGLTYALVPGHMKRMMARLQEVSVDQMRVLGTVVLAVGVFVIWLAHSLLPV